MWMNYWMIDTLMDKKHLHRAEFLSSTHAWNLLVKWNHNDRFLYLPAGDCEHYSTECHIVTICGEDLMPHLQAYMGE